MNAPLAATRFDREVMRGDTLTYLNQVFQDVTTLAIFTVPPTTPLTPPPANAVPFNLTGCSLWVTAKYQWPDQDSQAVFELTILAGSISIVVAANGTFKVNGPPSNTTPFPDSDVDLRLDTQLKDANGNIYTIEYGTLTVHPDVTRATS